LSPGDGWHTLLTRVCNREAEVIKSDAHPDQIRRLIERVALYARTDLSEPGHVSGLQISEAYRQIAEMEPVEAVQQVLMQLPGLSTGGAVEDRRFVDESLFEAAQAGTLVELIEHLSSNDRKILRAQPAKRLIELFLKTSSVITALTAQVVLAALREKSALGVVRPALREALRNEDLTCGNLAGDVFMCAAQQPDIHLGQDLPLIKLHGAYFKELELNPDVVAYSKVVLDNCLIDRFELDLKEDQLSRVEFNNTTVGTFACSSTVEQHLKQLGKDFKFLDKVTFDANNHDVLSGQLPKYLKAIITVSRNVFRPNIYGRTKYSFYRAASSLKQSLIDACLDVFLKNRLVYVVGNPNAPTSVWYPNRAQSRRANQLTNATNATSDKVVTELAELAQKEELYKVKGVHKIAGLDDT